MVYFPKMSRNDISSKKGTPQNKMTSRKWIWFAYFSSWCWRDVFSSLELLCKVRKPIELMEINIFSRNNANISRYNANTSRNNANISRNNANISRYNANISRYYANVSRYNANISRYYANVSRNNANVSCYNANISRYYANVSRNNANVSRYNANISRYYANLWYYERSCSLLCVMYTVTLLSGTFKSYEHGVLTLLSFCKEY